MQQVGRMKMGGCGPGLGQNDLAFWGGFIECKWIKVKLPVKSYLLFSSVFLSVALVILSLVWSCRKSTGSFKQMQFLVLQKILL